MHGVVGHGKGFASVHPRQLAQRVGTCHKFKNKKSVSWYISCGSQYIDDFLFFEDVCLPLRAPRQYRPYHPCTAAPISPLSPCSTPRTANLHVSRIQAEETS